MRSGEGVGKSLRPSWKPPISGETGRAGSATWVDGEKVNEVRLLKPPAVGAVVAGGAAQAPRPSMARKASKISKLTLFIEDRITPGSIRVGYD